MPTPIAASFVNVDRPLRGLLDLASTWQLDGVQLDTRHHVRPTDFGETARRQLRHYLSERRLKLSGLCVPTRSSLGELTHLDERLGAITAAMPLAFDLGCMAIVVRLGAWPDDEDGRQRLVRVLGELAEASNRFGPQLTVIPSAGSLEHLNEALTELAAPIAVQFDPTAPIFAGESVEAGLRSLHGEITQVRVRDGQRYGGEAGGQETTIGRGEVEWDLLAAMTADLPQLRWLVVERTEGTERAIDLQNGIAYTRSVFSPLGE